VQRSSVPASVNLVDLRGLDEGDFLNDAFMLAEMAHKGPDTHASTLFTQVLAGLVSERFDGMVVPGVKGDAAASGARTGTPT
jgi:hypothetical protein